MEIDESTAQIRLRLTESSVWTLIRARLRKALGNSAAKAVSSVRGRQTVRTEMQVAKPVGRNAPAIKYDILSALTVHALSGDKHRQRSILRVIALITTRYNWRSNELSIGREEIARLWSVNERTVKREMAKLRTMGWITVKRPAARGRVAVYEFDLKQLIIDTSEVWPTIGPDFQARMTEEPEGDTNIVPFKVKPPAPESSNTDVWTQVPDHSAWSRSRALVQLVPASDRSR